VSFIPRGCRAGPDYRHVRCSHAVFAYGYDQSFVNVLTWGNTQPGTWAWWDECVDEAYAILPPEASNPGFAPGFNITQLKQDLDGVAH
jgi:hypothetical protein